MGKTNIYIEPRADGTFAVTKTDAKRASAIRETQRDAIDAAKAMFPDIKPAVARVRQTGGGKPDQFRKA